MTAGLWARAGQTGSLVGLNWDAVTKLMPKGLDKDRVIYLLRCWEGGMIEGAVANEKAAADRREALRLFNAGQGGP